MVGAMGDLVPDEAKAQLGPMQSMVATLGGALFGGQLGQALGQLAAEVLSAGDIGLPLGPNGTAALVPANIKSYGEGLELPEDQVRLYVALREAAHQRLFGHVPWLRAHVDRKSTRLNSSHVKISYAVFCLKKKKKTNTASLLKKKKKKKKITIKN